jgi:uncharacterized protein YyaL (SSP411 family)
MTSYFDLYGLLNMSIDEAAVMLEKIFSITFVARDSSFKGEYYSTSVDADEDLELQENFNKIEEDWTEPEFEQYPVILYVSDVRRAHEIENTLKKGMGENVVLLRRTEA